MAQARGFFERALALDPGNIEALVGTAIVDVNRRRQLSDRRPGRAPRGGRGNLDQGSVPGSAARAWPTCILGVVQIFTNRATQGIAECEQALALDRNLANAHALDRSCQIFYRSRRGDRGAISMRRSASLLAISSPIRWMMFVGLAKLQLNADAEAVAWLRRSIEANRNYPLAHFHLAAALALLGLLDEARAAAQAGLALNPSFTIRRFRASHRATIRLTSPGASASMRACAWPGCRRGNVRVGCAP